MLYCSVHPLGDHKTLLMFNTIVLLIPVLLIIVFIEWYISYKKEDQTYTTGNFAMNLAIGAMDQVCSLIYFAALYLVLEYTYSHFSLFQLENSWYNWVFAYVLVDFLSYWYHRFSHRVNILWAGHVTHHSSEHFNFSNGFRTSFFQGIYRILFWSCLPVFGFSPLMLVVILKVSGLYDFALHTKYIPKLGFLEKILITPSQHRVHHGRNDIYIDKNYGSTFVIWDKLFGTFQEETEEVQYGIKGPYVDNNPFMAIGYYYHYLWKAMKTQTSFSAKFLLLFLSPDKTPKPNLNTSLPIHTNHVDETLLKQYAYFQVVCAVPGLIAMLFFKNFISVWEIGLYSLIGISSIGMGAMILNGNTRINFPRIEFFRLGILLCLVMVAFVIKVKFYLLSLAFFLLVSIFLIAVLRKENNSTVPNR
jgi:alkylglycerol monooxygenase